MRILGIETSCDETGIAIYDDAAGLLADEIYTQTIHTEYGGVVPELASRDHIRKTLPLIDRALQQANTAPKELTAIAYTAGPGLAGALLVGAAVAASLAFAWEIPALPIHHMEGHLLAPLLENNAPTFPFLALLVSGGHTLLVEASALGQYQILGESLDDAVGEAFDKTAKLLGLGYPGGAELAKLAEQGDGQRLHFPRPMIDRPGLDFSFSGLKTFALNTIERLGTDPKAKADVACAFQAAVVETLVIKCRRALRQTEQRQLVVAGGVSANTALRTALQTMATTENADVFFPRARYCTDNGAMIAYAGYERMKAGFRPSGVGSFAIKPRWPLSELT